MPPPDLTIEPMQPQDWSEVRAIMAEGLKSGVAAFTTRPPLWKDWDKGHLSVGRLVARNATGVLGWVALTPVADT
jgi:phosphinothricin acetyltransferase